MRYVPLNYDQITSIQGSIFPVSVKSYNNVSFAYWERSLFQRMCSVFDFKLPEEWQGTVSDFFYWCLFRFGFVMISRSDEFGYFFQPATVKGFNLYYQPVSVIVANPERKISGEYAIGSECEVLKLTPDFFGAWDIIVYYAEKLSQLDTAINTNLINSKIPYLLAAKNKASAEALKTMMDRVNRGEPAIYLDKCITNDRQDKDSPFQFLQLPDVAGNYIAPQQLIDLQTLLNSFDAEIGIPTVPYQKKERMVTDEANSRSRDAVSRITVWQRSLDASIIKINNLYPDLDISYEIRKDIREALDATEGGEADGNSEDDADRNG